MKGLCQWVDGILDRVISVGGAAAFSQIPEFIQQYVQRLGGHADEAMRQVAMIEKAARASGKTMAVYISAFTNRSDPDLIHQGEFLQETVNRASELQQSLTVIQDAPAFTKWFILLINLDMDIAENAMANFRPAVPLSLENLVYAGFGVIVALAAYHFVLKFPLGLLRKFFSRDLVAPLRSY